MRGAVDVYGVKPLHETGLARLPYRISEIILVRSDFACERRGRGAVNATKLKAKPLSALRPDKAGIALCTKHMRMT